jgi:hypothetical protein
MPDASEGSKFLPQAWEHISLLLLLGLSKPDVYLKRYRSKGAKGKRHICQLGRNVLVPAFSFMP